MASGGASRWNLSQWALQHRSLVTYFILVVVIFGMYGYTKLPQAEAPPFTVKVMVIKTLWPGATTKQVREQVTVRISRELQELPKADYVRAYSRPGESLIFFVVQDSTPSGEVSDVWYQVRKHVNDMAHKLPKGTIGPFFNDEFGDVYTNIYALEGEGYSFAELKDYADLIRRGLLRIPDVDKVDFFGERAQRVFIDIANKRLAALGINPKRIVSVLREQNAVAPAGYVATDTQHVRIGVSGTFDNVERIRQVSFRVDGRLIKLGDIAHIYRGYKQPPTQTMRFNGDQVLGIGVTMAPDGNVVELGEKLKRRITRLRQSLPAGLTLEPVTSMPEMVKQAVSEFLHSVGEAVVIVLLVSLVTLGLRTGAVIVVTIPLVLAATAMFMWLFGIGLNKVSLGTLILALGLLVDDAIIAIEMMSVKLEQGYERLFSAGFAYTSTAFPMLTGTLVTVAGFLPIAFAQSATGEYTRALFQVSAIALLVSWVASVIVVPYLGYKLIPDLSKHRQNPVADWLRRHVPLVKRLLPAPATDEGKQAQDVYHTPFYSRLRKLVAWCVHHRKTVLTVTIVIFGVAMYAFKFVPQQFFPVTARPEILVDLRMPEGASRQATLQQVKKMETFLEKQPEVKRYTAFVGSGVPRFFLPLDEKLPQRNFAQFLVLTDGLKARDSLREKISNVFDSGRFAMVRGRAGPLVGGPPVSYPIQFRVSGRDIDKVRDLANKVLAVVREHPATMSAHMNWDEPSKVVRLDVNQKKARALGLSSQTIADFLHMSLAGFNVTGLRGDDEAVNVVLRAAPGKRTTLQALQSLAIPVGDGRSVSLSQVARFEYVQRPGIIWGRNGRPTITVMSGLRAGAQGIDVTREISPKLDALRPGLPLGYDIEVGGKAEASSQAQSSIFVGIPFMLFAIFTLLMVQLQNFRLTLMVVVTAPLGLIGVTAGLLLFGKPFGFVAMVGTIAMFGIIMRNSVILVDQIKQDIASGLSRHDAVVEATVRRFRPIMLTAAAAVLALIPLARSNFFGPMAVALMSGITVATVLTSFVLPALYASWMRVSKDEPAR